MRDGIYSIQNTDLNKGFRRLLKFTIIFVPARVAHFMHSASTFLNGMIQRSLLRGYGTSINPNILERISYICLTKLSTFIHVHKVAMKIS